MRRFEPHDLQPHDAERRDVERVIAKRERARFGSSDHTHEKRRWVETHRRLSWPL
jgi:hypothetical protein